MTTVGDREVRDYCARVEVRLEEATTDAPGYYDDAIRIMRDALSLPPGGQS